MIRVVLAEDQGLLLSALATLLEMEADIQVIGRAENGQDALEMIQSEKPDVLVTDIEMPFLSGLDVAAFIRQYGLSTKVLIVTTFARPGYLRRALDSGVHGYLLKDTPSAQLANAIRRVAQGLKVIDPELALEAWGQDDPLSERERQILSLAGAGSSNAEIAETYHLAEGTVRNYLSEILRKCDAKNRTEAFRIAKQNGWL